MITSFVMSEVAHSPFCFTACRLLNLPAVNCHDIFVDLTDLTFGPNFEIFEILAKNTSSLPRRVTMESSGLHLSLGPEAMRVATAKAQLVAATAREAGAGLRTRAKAAERGKNRLAIFGLKREVTNAVNAPVSGGRDPTAWLPDELMLVILMMLPFDALWGGVCERVCQRWRRLMKSTPVQRLKSDGRWVAYEAGAIAPRVLRDGSGDTAARDAHSSYACSIAVGLDGNVYLGYADGVISVLSRQHPSTSPDSAPHAFTPTHTYLRTLGDVDTGHSGPVTSLAVGLDGKIFSGSHGTIRVWSGDDGRCLKTRSDFMGHVYDLAVGLDGKVYSGSSQGNIRVWSGDACQHIQTLEGHTGPVLTLAVGLDGALYSGSYDKSVRVWSADDGSHLRTLVGHTHPVSALAVGVDGNVFSGSWDGRIRVWSGKDGSLLKTLEGHTRVVTSLAVGADGRVLSGSDDATLRVWGTRRAIPRDTVHLHTVRTCKGEVKHIVMGSDGSVYSLGWARDGAKIIQSTLLWQ
jgi:hypothetical protein